MTRFANRLLLTTLAALTLLGCKDLQDPLAQLERELAQYPTYSVILQDMDRSGNFFQSNYHRYKVVTGDGTGEEIDLSTRTTDWFEVDEKFYGAYLGYLGMVVLSKDDSGKVARLQRPPGYYYVGNSRYGAWQNDSYGRRYWQYHPRYDTYRDLSGGPIYEDDYKSYRRSHDSGKAWFGTDGKTYGTQGTQTKKANPTFFQRQQARQATRKQSFGDKVASRTGRSTMSKSRSRSSGRGGK